MATRQMTIGGHAAGEGSSASRDGGSRESWTPGPAAHVHRLAVAQVKALACELPAASGTPLAKWSCPELARETAARTSRRLSRRPQCAAGSRRTCSSRGSTGPGSFPRPVFRSQGRPRSTCMSGSGRPGRWPAMSMCSVPMRNPAYRPAAAFSRPRLLVSTAASSGAGAVVEVGGEGGVAPSFYLPAQRRVG